jgi:hypothetical protein
MGSVVNMDKSLGLYFLVLSVLVRVFRGRFVFNVSVFVFDKPTFGKPTLGEPYFGEFLC